MTPTNPTPDAEAQYFASNFEPSAVTEMVERARKMVAEREANEAPPAELENARWVLALFTRALELTK